MMLCMVQSDMDFLQGRG